MLKHLLSLFSFIAITTVALGQTVPPECQPPGTTVPAESCQTSCINCNFDDYMGTTAGFGPDNTPILCGNWSIQNDQWLGFIAGGTGTATFTVTPSNCAAGNGVQVAVYNSCDGAPLGCNAGCQVVVQPPPA